MTHTILCIVGARPNFMKIAPLMAAMEGHHRLVARLVHTGQHYDAAMNDQFFADLGIPAPHINLEVGSGSHAVQTADIMRRFEPVLDGEQPAAVLVVGDVNSTIACALVAAKKGFPVVHVEAGLRSFDRTMPEEINRVLTDQVSDLLFTTERLARNNLLREGIADDAIHFVGNVMIDTLHRHLPHAMAARELFSRSGAPAGFTGEPGSYAGLTLHRPSNVDSEATLRPLLEALRDISQDIPLVFPLHPRTRGCMERFGLMPLLDGERILVLPPLGYLDMLGLTRDARFFMTDSGGLQEETTALGVPCLTLRDNTEREVTISEGTNTLVGTDPRRLREEARQILSSGGKAGRIPEYWDGHAAERIVQSLGDWLDGRQPRRSPPP